MLDELIKDDSISEVPFGDMKIAKDKKYEAVNMNEVVGTHDILFVCLDTLRYDVAKEEEDKNNTPVLNRYGKWRIPVEPVLCPEH